MRSAIVHDWLTSKIGGAEKVLEAIHQLFPSPIYTLVKDLKKLEGGYFEGLEIHSSLIEKLPKAKTKYRNYLPLFPLAIQRFDLKEYDLIISSSHCAAKGVITSSKQVHICYCHTPMRYAWDMLDEYLMEFRGVKRAFVKWILHRLRRWDLNASKRVDHFIANSQFVAERIEKFYGRKAEVIYPFVDTSFYSLVQKKGDYYLTASRFVPYKKIDLIVEAFSQMPNRRLVVIGDGPEWKKIKAKANVEIIGAQSDTVLKEYMQKAKAFVFAAVEDFGITPVEAMACGTPVIALNKGGVRESVIDKVTGLFFNEQTCASLIEAVGRFEMLEIDPNCCRKRAEEFSKERFNQQFSDFVRKNR